MILPALVGSCPLARQLRLFAIRQLKTALAVHIRNSNSYDSGRCEWRPRPAHGNRLGRLANIHSSHRCPPSGMIICLRLRFSHPHTKNTRLDWVWRATHSSSYTGLYQVSRPTLLQTVCLDRVLTTGALPKLVSINCHSIFQGTLINAAVWTNVGIVSIWIVAFFFSNLLQCWPISVNWAEFGAPLGTCVDTTRMYLAEAYSDVFTDCM